MPQVPCKKGPFSSPIALTGGAKPPPFPLLSGFCAEMAVSLPLRFHRGVQAAFMAFSFWSVNTSPVSSNAGRSDRSVYVFLLRAGLEAARALHRVQRLDVLPLSLTPLCREPEHTPRESCWRPLCRRATGIGARRLRRLSRWQTKGTVGLSGPGWPRRPLSFLPHANDVRPHRPRRPKGSSLARPSAKPFEGNASSPSMKLDS